VREQVEGLEDDADLAADLVDVDPGVGDVLALQRDHAVGRAEGDRVDMYAGGLGQRGGGNGLDLVALQQLEATLIKREPVNRLPVKMF